MSFVRGKKKNLTLILCLLELIIITTRDIEHLTAQMRGMQLSSSRQKHGVSRDCPITQLPFQSCQRSFAVYELHDKVSTDCGELFGCL